MAFDALSLRAVAGELGELVIGSRITKIYQPTGTDIELLLHKQGVNRRLLLSAHAQNARVHVTKSVRENPPAPPMFCMLLRKHLDGGIIIAAAQPGLERVLKLVVTGENELGERTAKLLIAEMMGKHSNIILVDRASGVIIDSIRRVSRAISRVREVLPGRLYVPPPAQDKTDPLALAGDAFPALLRSGPGEEKIWRLLLNSLAGLSPLLAKDIAVRAGLAPERTAESLTDPEWDGLKATLVDFYQSVRNRTFTPSLAVDRKTGAFLAYAPFPLAQYPAAAGSAGKSMNEVLDIYYATFGQGDKTGQARQTLLRTVGAALARCRKKETGIAEALTAAQNALSLQLAGELILANIHRLRQGDSVLTAVNYYDPAQPEITVELDARFTPAENAQRYFKQYAKAKKSLAILGRQQQENAAEISYLENVETLAAQAGTAAELADIRQEMIEQGYLAAPASRRNNKTRPEEPSQPLRRITADGYTVLVGRNNKQNDRLTLREAAPDDIWLHTKDIPGSHVIIRVKDGRPVPETTLREAAALAAYYSKARASANVPVDYTAVRHVRKPRGAKPGMVIYDHQKTVFADPHPGRADE
ncbi:MAG: Rqc2 family fibronectin-binding protein [bacterium]